jgi:hypothetical protein
MKLFGKELFEKKKKDQWEEYLYDFHQHGGGHSDGYAVQYVTAETVGWSNNTISGTITTSGSTAAKKKKAEEPKKDITPKELYNLDTLQDELFQLKVDPKYILKEQKLLEKKIKLMMGDSGGNRYGRIELQSMIERLGNRLKIEDYLDVVEEYPHTSTARINDIVKEHKNLRFRLASEFIPDMPEEAVLAMNKYKEMCQALCKKDPVFYIIADQKDFGEKDRRRDPILLAQSPFGFFWQILGAWDEEMVYLGDL